MSTQHHPVNNTVVKEQKTFVISKKKKATKLKPLTDVKSIKKTGPAKLKTLISPNNMPMEEKKPEDPQLPTDSAQ